MEPEEMRERMRIKFLLAPHVSAEDARLIEENFTSCDIYIPEYALCKPDLLAGQELHQWLLCGRSTTEPESPGVPCDPQEKVRPGWGHNEK